MILDRNKNLCQVSCRCVDKEYKTQEMYKLILTQTASQNLANGSLRSFQAEEYVQEFHVTNYIPDNIAVQDATAFVIPNNGETMRSKREK